MSAGTRQSRKAATELAAQITAPYLQTMVLAQGRTLAIFTLWSNTVRWDLKITGDKPP